MRAIFTSVVLLVALMAQSACNHASGLRDPENVRLSFSVRVLSTVDEDVMAFTDAAIVTSFVWIEVLAPAEQKKERVQLILHRSAARLRHPRPAVGEEWKKVGSMCEIEVVLNRKSAEVFLYPPIGIPHNEIVF